MWPSVNIFLSFLGRADCRVNTLRIPRQAYCPELKELTKEEYLRLLKAKPQLHLLQQTICATGIRVLALWYFTVKKVAAGEIGIICKGKNRRILIPGKLKKILQRYTWQKHITSGPIFLEKENP